MITVLHDRFERKFSAGTSIATPMKYILEIKNLVKDYSEVRAVDDISFAIEPGICFGLLGPNGAGKTTTIEVIEGILKQTGGEILYKEKPRLAGFKEEAGIQFQNTELPQYLTVRETLVMFRKLYSRKADMDELIAICRLEEILDRDNRKISGGQKQRLLLAMALANDPELLFLDEPTTGLDPQARHHLWNIVKDIKSRNKTIILTTHYMEEAELLCDRIAIMDTGKIIAMGSPSELLKEHANRTIIVIRNDINEENLCSLPCRYFKIHDGYEIQTDNLNTCLQALMKSNVDLSDITVRSQNLEDLFLKLTGKELRT
jgi:ABC-2 type transport system ATP-binding protein